MGLFDAFSSGSAINQAGNAFSVQKKQISKAQDRIREYGGLARDTYTGAEQKATDYLTGAKGESLGYIDQGTGQAVGALGSALDLYSPLADLANKGYAAYGDFYGLGGQEGFDRANQSWMSSPMYQAMVGESSMGQQALDRQAQARGNPYNATDTLEYQGNLAGRHLGDYTAGLSPYLQLAPQLAGAQAGIYGDMANIYNQAGRDRATIATGAGRDLSDLTTGTADDIGGSYAGEGGSLAGLHLLKGQAGQQYYQSVAQANAAADQNLWGAILGLGSLGVKAYTG